MLIPWRAVVKERKDGLNTWMKAVMPICPGDRHPAMFLAQDHSVAPPLLEKIGLGNQRKGMDGSRDATKVALSMEEFTITMELFKHHAKGKETLSAEVAPQ